MLLISLATVACAIVILAFLRKSPTQDQSTQEQDFVSKEKQVSAQEKIKEILSIGCSRLGLKYAVALIHEDDQMLVLSKHTTSYWPFSWQENDALSKSIFFSGEISEISPRICIDFVSMSDWRDHPTHANMEVEVFIGAKVPNAPISIAFFDTTPRLQLFSYSEKEFVSHLSDWVASLTRGVEAQKLQATAIERDFRAVEAPQISGHA